MQDNDNRDIVVAALRHAAPYIRMFKHKTFVLKAGGEIFASVESTRALVEQIAILHQVGIRVVLVHGGGPQSTALAKSLGMTTEFIEGRRVTDEKSLEVAAMVLNGQINTRILAACRDLELPAVGISGVDAGLIRAHKRPPVNVAGRDGGPVDYGFVGDIDAVDADVLRTQLDNGLVPVISPLSADESGTLAPRLGGLEIELSGRAVSRPYLRVSADMLERFSIKVDIPDLSGTGSPGRCTAIHVPAGGPQASRIEIAPDASSAAVWWSAVTLRGGEVLVPGLRADSKQADVAALAWLERMGAEVDRAAGGSVRVCSEGRRLVGLGRIDLSDAPDLVFLLGCLAATAEGDTLISGLSATRAKESDRVAVLARGLRTLGGKVRIGSDDSLHVQGSVLHGGLVHVGGDHRAAMAFGILGLAVPGVRLTGRVREVEKSHPDFFAQLAALAGA